MALQTLILATRNQGKVRELAGPLAEFGFEVRLPDPDTPDVEETGATFEENALLKARVLAEMNGLPALADDSGLEVDALGGRPGVWSARYGDDIPFAHPGESRDERNIRKLLAALENVVVPRAGRFRCCMALTWPSGAADARKDLVANGNWEGHIATEAKGTNGFGYDPVFVDPETGLSAAQMEPAVKMARSHRAKALAALLAELRKRGRAR